MTRSFEQWMNQVNAAFDSLSMPLQDWHAIGAFDYRSEYDAGAHPNDAAMKAHHYWWHEWNKSLKQNCRETKDCWLPRGHQGQCEPIAGTVPQR